MSISVPTPRCTDCGRAGVAGQHKEADCIRCPECNAILVREVTP